MMQTNNSETHTNAGPPVAECGFPTSIAIDPGRSGGIAIIRAGEPVSAVTMPMAETDIVNLLADIAPRRAVLEEVGGYVGKADPGSAMFKFGRNFGLLLGVLMGMRVPVELIKPQAWQKRLALGSRPKEMSKADWKRKLKDRAARANPHMRVTLATADALLILEAFYGLPGVSTLREPQDASEVPF